MLFWIGVTIGIILLALLLIFLGYFNKIIRLENRIDNSWAQINVQLQRRGDLIPNLMETVKGYMKHERETLESVTKARTALMKADSRQKNMDANNMLTDALKSLFAVAENYPDLKANENFLNLQDELSHTEDKIAYARQHYNDTVLAYNNTIETFPGVIFARAMNKQEKDMLRIPAETRKLPRVSF